MTEWEHGKQLLGLQRKGTPAHRDRAVARGTGIRQTARIWGTAPGDVDDIDGTTHSW